MRPRSYDWTPSFNILTSPRVFWHLCTLNPSILAAIKLSNAKRFGNQWTEPEQQPAAVTPQPRADNFIPERFLSRLQTPQYARGTPNHANCGFDPFSGR